MKWVFWICVVVVVIGLISVFAATKSSAKLCEPMMRTPHDYQQVPCCCWTIYNEECCDYVWVCPGPIPSCPCAY